MFLKVSEVSYNVQLKNINIKTYFPPADDLSLVLRICTNITTTENPHSLEARGGGWGLQPMNRNLSGGHRCEIPFANFPRLQVGQVCNSSFLQEETCPRFQSNVPQHVTTHTTTTVSSPTLPSWAGGHCFQEEYGFRPKCRPQHYKRLRFIRSNIHVEYIHMLNNKLE